MHNYSLCLFSSCFMSYLILCKIERFMIYSYDLSAELIDRLNLII